MMLVNQVAPLFWTHLEMKCGTRRIQVLDEDGSHAYYCNFNFVLVGREVLATSTDADNIFVVEAVGGEEERVGVVRGWLEIVKVLLPGFQDFVPSLLHQIVEQVEMLVVEVSSDRIQSDRGVLIAESKDDVAVVLLLKAS
jgi:hypothetical protein